MGSPYLHHLLADVDDAEPVQELGEALQFGIALLQGHLPLAGQLPAKVLHQFALEKKGKTLMGSPTGSWGSALTLPHPKAPNSAPKSPCRKEHRGLVSKREFCSQKIPLAAPSSLPQCWGLIQGVDSPWQVPGGTGGTVGTGGTGGTVGKGTTSPTNTAPSHWTLFSLLLPAKGPLKDTVPSL